MDLYDILDSGNRADFDNWETPEPWEDDWEDDEVDTVEEVSLDEYLAEVGL